MQDNGYETYASTTHMGVLIYGIHH